MLIGRYNYSVILTYLGVISALVGIHFTMYSRFNYAFICLIVAGICDMFDGVVARRCKRDEDAKMFGVEIDSLSDIINFVAFPAVIAFKLGVSSGFSFAVVCIYTLGGVIRLAYFNMLAKKNKGEKMKYYRGLPVTTAAIVFPLLWFFYQFTNYNTFHFAYITAMGIVGTLFITNFKLKKPGMKTYIVLLILAIIVSTTMIVTGG